jgi:outer membrane immunogenic protein
MRFFALAILAVTAFASAPSFAQTATASNPLVGRTYVSGGYDHTQTAAKINTGTVSGRVGYNFTPNFGVEGQGGIGVNSDRLLGVEARTRGTLGAFAVASAPVAERLSLIGRAGYVHTWAEAKSGAVKVRGDDGSFAVGAGAQYMVDDANGIRADYTRYTEGKGADGFAVSYVRKF